MRCRSVFIPIREDYDQCLLPRGHTGVHCGEVPMKCNGRSFRVWTGPINRTNGVSQGFIAWMFFGEMPHVWHRVRIQEQKGRVLPE